MSHNFQISTACAPLLTPCRYKVLYGGRGSAKSWSAARALLYQGTLNPLRILCTREVMRTIADSVHRTITDQIALLGLQDWYSVTENAILGRNGTEFLFAGLRTMDAAKIKSYEGVNRAWVEEAHTVSAHSWDILIPTIRADNSEIWVTFNPELSTDDTYKRFIVNPPSGAWIQKLTWEDNPWFPEVLQNERSDFLKRVAAGLRTQEDYNNIWEGECRSVVEGAIYTREIGDMMESRRIRNVPYNPKVPVHTIWDLGWNDQTTILFVQRVISEVCVIDYEEASFLRYDEWAKKLQAKPYTYGSHWLPHDGANQLQAAAGESAQKQLATLLKMRPKIVKKPATVEEPIRAARMMFPRVYMDSDKTVRLQDCLKHFRRGVPESTGEPGMPIKDEYRHGADAFGYLAMVVDQLRNDERPVIQSTAFEPLDRGLGM